MSFITLFTNKSLNGNSYNDMCYLAHKQHVMKVGYLHVIQNDFSFERNVSEENKCTVW